MEVVNYPIINARPCTYTWMYSFQTLNLIEAHPFHSGSDMVNLKIVVCSLVIGCCLCSKMPRKTD